MSPDGKWLAYQSNDLGSNQVYAQAFQADSAGKNLQHTWRRARVERRESHLLLSSEGDVMAADVTVAGDALRAAQAASCSRPPGSESARAISDSMHAASASWS
jgi:Tol biopolymer transport system component